MATHTFSNLSPFHTKRGNFKIFADEDYDDTLLHEGLDLSKLNSVFSKNDVSIKHIRKSSYCSIDFIPDWYYHAVSNHVDLVSCRSIMHFNTIAKSTSEESRFAILGKEISPNLTAFTKIIDEVFNEVYTSTSVIYKDINENYPLEDRPTILPENVIKNIKEELELVEKLGLEIDYNVLKHKLFNYVETIYALNPTDLFIAVTPSLAADIHVILDGKTSLSLKKPLSKLPELEEDDFIFSLLISGNPVLTAVSPLSEIIEGAKRLMAV